MQEPPHVGCRIVLNAAANSIMQKVDVAGDPSCCLLMVRLALRVPRGTLLGSVSTGRFADAWWAVAVAASSCLSSCLSPVSSVSSASVLSCAVVVLDTVPNQPRLRSSGSVGAFRGSARSLP